MTEAVSRDIESRKLEQVSDPVVIMTDLHGRHDILKWVLNQYGSEATYIQLGDFSDDYRSLERIASLLLEHEIHGVYGNHDFGLMLAVRVTASVDRVSRVVRDYCCKLTRTIEIGDFLFCHAPRPPTTRPWSTPGTRG